ncbi:MAG: hypothetical protein FKY71_08900 [Spiribacter salinus]|uniref:Uncharacterized protein n=1 Tax=Spiribacter salinus TaxID=1335746 RepID=A0A540VRL4_9GAMM|nr:MAG: hypothetical protein FKY71_08900 [Spiribacter salinus]
MGNQYLAAQYVTIVALEDDNTETAPYDAVEELLKDASADIVYLDVVGSDGCQIQKDTSAVGNDVARGTSDGKRHALIKERANVTLNIPLRAFLEEGVGPHYGPVLQAAGFAESVDTDDVIYTRGTKNQPALTVYKIWRSSDSDNWKIDYATGVRLSAEFSVEAGSEATVSFTGTGNYHEITDGAEYINADGEVALLKDGDTPVTATSFTQDCQEPMPCRDIVFRFDGDDYEVQSFDLNVNQTVNDVDTINGSGSRSRGVIARGADERSEGSCALVGYTDDLMEDIRAKVYDATEFTWLAVLENGEGRIEMACDNAQLMRWSEAENGNLLQWDIPFALNGDCATLVDDELTITYMPASV